MKLIYKIFFWVTPVVLIVVFLLTGLTNDTVIDEHGYRRGAYPQARVTAANYAVLPFSVQTKYSDLIIEGEVLSVNPSEPAVYTYREGDMGVGFLQFRDPPQLEYELFTYQVKVTAIHKGTGRIVLDWLQHPDSSYLAPVIKVALPPSICGMNGENYTNVEVGDNMLLLLIDYNDGMYVPSAHFNSSFTIRDGMAYRSSYITEWYEEGDSSHVRLTDRPDMTEQGAYSELVREIRSYLYNF